MSKINNSHYSIAHYIMDQYSHFFKCVSVKYNVWFEFRNHHWIEIDSEYSLRNLINDELIPELEKKIAKLCTNAMTKESMARDRCFQKMENLSRIIKSCEMNSFRASVIKECAYIAYDADFSKSFLNQMNENPNLICFNNGVYDLANDNFREGEMNDYITLCTGYDYKPYDDADPIVAEIKYFLQQIQPDTELREYLLMVLASCIAGSCGANKIYLLMGSTGYRLMKLVGYVFGDLCRPMDAGFLEETKKQCCWDSEIGNKKGIRVCPIDTRFTTELGTALCSGLLKTIVGGDIFCAPNKYEKENTTYFKLQFKPFLLCDGVFPKIKAIDAAILERINLVKFSNSCPDITTDKMIQWRQMFMAMLIEYHKQYKLEGLKLPQAVMEATTEYRHQSKP